MSTWSQRIKKSNQIFDEWHTQFKCDKLEKYYEGKHYEFIPAGADPAVLNMYYATIKIKLANFLIQRPEFNITAKPGTVSFNAESAIKSAYLKQDVLNTYINKTGVDFADTLKVCAIDSFFRFGIMEVDHAADLRNPSAIPYEFDDRDGEIDAEDAKLVKKSGPQVNPGDMLYFKRIDPKCFRVSAGKAWRLDKVNWCGYYEYIPARVLKALAKDNKEFKIPERLSSIYYETERPLAGDEKDYYDGPGLVKIWRIFDRASQKKLMLLDGGNYDVMYEEDCEREPFVDLRWDYRLNSFYPIPLTFNWMYPQNEMNESLEQMRAYRRRYESKYQFKKGDVDPDNLEKFSNGGDGTIIETKNERGIQPITPPQVGPIVERSLMMSRDNFNNISGVSQESRAGGRSNRTTATESTIVDQRSKIRESAEQIDFSDFANRAARSALLIIGEKFTNDLIIQLSPRDQNPNTPPQIQPIYDVISVMRVRDGYDFDITLDIKNATPIAMEQEKAAFVQFVTFVGGNPLVQSNPDMIREAAYRFGYRNEKIITQMQQTAMAMMQIQLMGAAGSTDPAQPGTKQKQMAAPSQQQIQGQIQ